MAHREAAEGAGRSPGSQITHPSPSPPPRPARDRPVRLYPFTRVALFSLSRVCATCVRVRLCTRLCARAYRGNHPLTKHSSRGGGEGRGEERVVCGVCRSGVGICIVSRRGRKRESRARRTRTTNSADFFVTRLLSHFTFFFFPFSFFSSSTDSRAALLALIALCRLPRNRF